MSRCVDTVCVMYNPNIHLKYVCTVSISKYHGIASSIMASLQYFFIRVECFKPSSLL